MSVPKTEIPVLFTDQAACCGCEACLSICPVHAITMQLDEKGFWYPAIDNGLCIACMLCKKVCAFAGDQGAQV